MMDNGNGNFVGTTVSTAAKRSSALKRGLSRTTTNVTLLSVLAGLCEFVALCTNPGFWQFALWLIFGLFQGVLFGIYFVRKHSAKDALGGYDIQKMEEKTGAAVHLGTLVTGLYAVSTVVSVVMWFCG